jgi:hypothetical protein
MAAGESEAHLDLKRAALRWAYRNGFSCAAMEVRALRSNFRCDVVAHASGTRQARGSRSGSVETGEGVCAIFECKQSRADFLGHAFAESRAALELEALVKRKRRLEELLAVHHPNLRAGESLFQEYDTVRGVEALEHTGYRRVCREIACLQRGLSERSKFSRLVRYGCANLCYLVATTGIFAEHEVPEGWGVLTWDGTSVVGSEDGKESSRPVPDLRLVARPRRQEMRAGDERQFLRRIARAATRETAKLHAVPLGKCSREGAA